MVINILDRWDNEERMAMVLKNLREVVNQLNEIIKVLEKN